MFKKIFYIWQRFAQFLGNVQMILLLSILYWTVVTLIAIPYKILSNPLSISKGDRTLWNPRTPVENVLESMRKQS